MLSCTVASQHLKEFTVEGLNYVRIKFQKKRGREDASGHSSHHSAWRFETSVPK